MKKHYILFLLFILLILNVANSAIELEYKCHDQRCIEGSIIDFRIGIRNNLNFTIWIDNVYVKDNEYDRVLAFHIGKLITLEPEDVHYFNFSTEITAPTQGYTFSALPCFEAKRKDQWNQTISNEVCGNTKTLLTVLPLSKIECYNNSNCLDIEFCSTNKCVNVFCEEGMGARNHKCIDCNFLQKVEDNKCVFSKNKTSLMLLIIAALLLVYYFYAKRK